MENLNEKKCIPCSGDIPPLDIVLKRKLKTQIDGEWEFTHNETRLYRSTKFKDFATPLALAAAIGALAEEQWHHPELTIGFGHIDIEIWTHKIDDLVESDFIFAAKVDQIISKVLS
ncbi:4a-hydroxytetrahydrobiopterin dehydratase [Halobacteriovorax marinus]|uniref:4a-hydroxytetrahydrobiopterin dehydratase n=1 Tax=Halobacteriovorax marinus (strain ATCC BAA-682 / DSM 15412 / SJ) TaxID=862908 RepID=E1X0Y0_HALMS|nr:4a-hydroxytetrahydrobiopterin dehydratase [Halobacteriovorax marinus]ATH07828.1 4a-hydroxytetrahydrobiopterin dehydratase [Halobacteriovorax marinus]CBW26469.1 putative dehydratase [Halobacteriovorax marinus SJ]